MALVRTLCHHDLPGASKPVSQALMEGRMCGDAGADPRVDPSSFDSCKTSQTQSKCRADTPMKRIRLEVLSYCSPFLLCSVKNDRVWSARVGFLSIRLKLVMTSTTCQKLAQKTRLAARPKTAQGKPTKLKPFGKLANVATIGTVRGLFHRWTA